jgi:gentisate 1,2-dioxygenase
MAVESSDSAERIRRGSEIEDMGRPGQVISRFGAEQIRGGKEEQERRKKSPVYVDGDEVARQHERVNMVHIVDPRLGFNNRTHRFWINHLPPGGEEGQHWKTLGHRHTVEAVILWLSGHGHSIIDGQRYDWEAGDFICVPMFAWHRHINVSDDRARYAASTTGPLSAGLGQAVYEDERFPEYWVYAQEGEDALRTLIPGAAEAGSERVVAPEGAGRLYAEQVAYGAQEEARRRAGRVLVKGRDLAFEPTAMGRLAYVVDARVGFHVKALSTVVAEIAPGRRSGAHRHLYDEIDYVLAGRGRAVIDDRTYQIKQGDTLAIPVFAWHQYFNEGDEPLRILAHSTRPAMENLGLVLTQQGETAENP